MATNVVGLFDTHAHADYAVRQLIASGVDTQYISVVAADPGGVVRKETIDQSGNLASAGAVSGATSGLLVGGLIGLLVGATTLAAPPVGFLVAGPLAGLITGAGVGMVSGGLLGALIGLGLPEEEAHIYAESVRRGGTMVTVEVQEADRLRVEQILAMAGAVNVQERAALYRQNGFTAYDPNLPVYTPEEVAAERARLGIVPAAVPTTVVTDPGVPGSAVVSTSTVPPAGGATVVEETYVVPDSIEPEFRAHFDRTYAASGSSYDAFRPAYRFGNEMAHRAEFRGLTWETAEPQARALWERSNPGTWDRYRDAIQTGWSLGGTRVSNTGASLI
ncbi:hypothetical protein [Fimbriimonas ginsengisoli]|uniref:General stress protein 17M-like domain-containing protein n=1 Tax=Fimbriimonas ginsengisoli Gsoil 348 TaxID=661478 RepID=A0A068NN07_FIMGI|nr:hypothetical protein [Fimbriimonas ginsengisoli]AIE84110.1 hypothetical protein OP10G_0742 [Fimbriimonas ginsengisoli Gsoil 348]